MKSKKAQISAELMIVMSILFVIFAVVFFISYDNSDIFSSLINEKYAKKQAHLLAQEINNAYISGDGFSRQISFPLALRTDVEYNLTVNNSARLAIVEWTTREKRAYSYPLITSNISGILSPINKSGLSIINTNGQITIS